MAQRLKASACNVGDLGSIPGSGGSPGEGNGNVLWCSCLENPMDGGAWWATINGVSKSQTRLSDFTSLHFNDVSKSPCKRQAGGPAFGIADVIMEAEREKAT